MLDDHASLASALRRKAELCRESAARARLPEEHDRLLRLRLSYLALAENEDWLGGLTPISPAGRGDAKPGS
jgi:hypothetical protein